MSISAIKKLRGFTPSKRSESRGFTLIELLIVIAVLGVLAAGVLVAINPAEQLARARDASRKTTVGQLNKAAQAYYTTQQSYPVASATWMTTLKNAGEIKSEPAATTYSVTGSGACAGATATVNSQSGFCYVTNAAASPTEAVVYTPLESGSEKAKCTGTNKPYFLWSSTDGKAGVVCDVAGGPTALTYSTYQ